MLWTPQHFTRRNFLRHSRGLLAGAALAPLSCAELSGPAAAEASGATERVVEALYAAYAEMNVEKMLALLTDDCFFEDPTFHLVARGKPEIRKLVEPLAQHFSNVKIDIENRIACQGWVVTQQKLSGFLRPHDGADGAGKNISVRGATIFSVRNNRISRWVDYYDILTYRQQLGLKADA
jgi:steroid delta-isomerase-like uncharacterized protein